MKKIVFIYQGDDWYKEIPIKSDSARSAFEDWHIRGISEGIEFFRANIDWYDLKKGVFLKSWAFRDGRWLKIEADLEPDMVFDKVAGDASCKVFELKQKIAQQHFFFNDPTFRLIFNNKFTQYLVLGEWMAETKMIVSRHDFFKEIKSIPGEMLVLKEAHGSGGNKVLIEEKGIIDIEKIKFPVLAQEFIEARSGMPKIVSDEDISDLRLVFINHELIYSLSRIAKRGSLFTNFHQGANAVFIERKDLPKEVLDMSAKIIEKLKFFPKAHYSLDFIFDQERKPVLLEINTAPGFSLLHFLGTDKLKEENFRTFIDLLKENDE